MRYTKLLFVPLLALSLQAAAVERSNSLAVTQNTLLNTWTATCTAKATGVKSSNAFFGNVWIAYTDTATETEQVLVNTNYLVGPNGTTWSYTDPAGVWSLRVEIGLKSVLVRIKATQPGPLTQTTDAATGFVSETGRLACRVQIVRGTGPTDPLMKNIHNFTGVEYFGYTH